MASLVKAVETISLTFSSTDTAKSATLSSAIDDHTRCDAFVTVAGVYPAGGSTSIGDQYSSRMFRVDFSSSSGSVVCTVTRGTSDSVTATVAVEIVQYASTTTVSTYSFSIGSGLNNGTQSITAVSSLSKSFLNVTNSSTATISGFEVVHLLTFKLGSTSTIRFDRGNSFSASPQDVRARIIEDSNLSTEAGQITFVNSSAGSASITSIGSLSNAFTIATRRSTNFGVSDNDQRTMQVDFASTTSVRASREATSSVTHTVEFAAIRIDNASTNSEVEHIDGTFSSVSSNTLSVSLSSTSIDPSKSTLVPSLPLGEVRSDLGGTFSSAVGYALSFAQCNLSGSTGSASVRFDYGSSSTAWPTGTVRKPITDVVYWGTLEGSSTPTTVTEAEQVGVADSATVSLATTETEQVGVADATEAGLATTETEQVGVADATEAGLATTEAEQVGVADSATVSLATTEAEQVGVADATEAGLATTETEQVEIRDGSSTGLAITQTEKASVADATAAGLATTETEQVRVADATEAGLATTETEQVGVADATEAGLATTETEQVGVADAESIQTSAPGSVSQAEQVGVADSATVSLATSEAEQVGVADDASAGTTLPVSEADDVGVADATATGLAIPEAEQVGVGDAVTIQLTVTAPAEDIGIQDIATPSVLQFTEAVGVADSVVTSAIVAGTEVATIRGRTSSISLSGRVGSTSLRGRSGSISLIGKARG